MNINEVSRTAVTSQLTRQDKFAPAPYAAGTNRPRESPAASRTVQDPSAPPAPSTPSAPSGPSAPPETPSADGGASFNERLKAAVEKIQEFISATASDIAFSIDEDSGRTVVKVIERESQEVIRQIPSEEMLNLAKALDKLQGLLLKQQA
jgi:flagellar protein FlaG